MTKIGVIWFPNDTWDDRLLSNYSVTYKLDESKDVSLDNFVWWDIFPFDIMRSGLRLPCSSPPQEHHDLFKIFRDGGYYRSMFWHEWLIKAGLGELDYEF